MTNKIIRRHQRCANYIDLFFVKLAEIKKINTQTSSESWPQCLFSHISVGLGTL